MGKTSVAPKSFPWDPLSETSQRLDELSQATKCVLGKDGITTTTININMVSIIFFIISSLSMSVKNNPTNQGG